MDCDIAIVDNEFADLERKRNRINQILYYAMCLGGIDVAEAVETNSEGIPEYTETHA